MKKIIYTLSSAFVAVLLFASLQASAQTPAITLIQPTGGETWTDNGTYLISWTDNFAGSVVIKLWNGSAYKTLATVASGTTYAWNTSNNPSPNGPGSGAAFKIKVQSTNGFYSDESTAFSLVDEAGGTITLNQPTGGEVWGNDGTYLISWNDNITSSVKVELYSGSGISLEETIAASATGTTVSWTPSGLSPGEYTIRVSSTVSPTNVTPAESADFTITASTGTTLDVLQPDGGESWSVGTTHLISWDDNLPETVDIQLWDYVSPTAPVLIAAADAGLASATSLSGSTWAWPIPGTITQSTTYRIKVKSSLTPTSTISSTSAANFSLTATSGSIIDVLQPDGGEIWSVGTTHLISWNDDLPEKVAISLWDYVSPTAPVEITASAAGLASATSLSGSTWAWTIPAGITLQGVNYKINVKSTATGSTISNTSAAVFTLAATSGTYIDVLQPDGGESWARDDTYLISWDDDLPEDVSIELYDGATQIGASAAGLASATALSGSTWAWTIPGNITQSANYKIKILSTAPGSTISNTSLNDFTIAATSGTYIDVLQPDGGEDWMAGTAHLISWDDNLPENVAISLWDYVSPTAPVEITGNTGLASATSLSGSTWAWTIPSDLVTSTVSSTLRIKIESTATGSISSTSAANFTIRPYGKSPGSSNITLSGGFASNNVTMYPNPTTGQLTIAAPGNINSVLIRNLLGQVIYSNNVEATKTNIDVSAYNAGVYIVNIIVEGEKVTKKLFVH